MFNKRKLISRGTQLLTLISLVSVISVSLLSSISCAKKKKTFSIAYMEIWADGIKMELRNICDEWAKENGVTLTYVEEWKLADADTHAANMITSKNSPDLAMFPNHLAVAYQSDLRDLSGAMDSILVAYPAGVQDVSKAMLFKRGKWIGIPVFSWSHLLVARKDILDQLGEKTPQTYDDLARLVKKMGNSKLGLTAGFGLGLGKDDDFAMFFQSLLWAFGGSVFDTTGTRIIFNSTETRQAVEYVMKLYQDKVFPTGALQWDGAANNKEFLAKRIGLTFNSPTIYYVAKQKDPDLAGKIVHALYPKNAKGDRHAYVTGFSFVTRADNNNRALVDSFLEYLFRPDNYKRLIIAGGGSVNPSVKGLEKLSIWEDPNLKIALESMQYEHPVGWPGPVTKTAADVFRNKCITKVFAYIIDDKLSIDEAIQKATADITETVSNTNSNQ